MRAGRVHYKNPEHVEVTVQVEEGAPVVVGAMRIEGAEGLSTKEIDALRTMGFGPIRYLVLPRTLALVLVAPILTLLADLVGVRGGVCALTKCDLAAPDIVELAADEVREVLRLAGLTGGKAAKVLGLGPKGDRTIRRWVGEDTPIPYAAWALLCDYAGLGLIWKEV